MIAFDNETRTFYLETGGTSYIFQIYEQGLLFQLYYGKKISRDPLTYLGRFCQGPLCAALPGTKGEFGSMERIPNEFPFFGFGDYRTPAISVKNADGSRVCQPTYKSHRIFDGKLPLEGMPSFSASKQDAQTLEITLEDPLIRLEVKLYYTVYEEEDLIIRSARVTNHGQTPLCLEQISSANLDLPSCDYRLLELWGVHTKEFQTDIAPLRHGTHVIESKYGTTGHQYNPFMALLSRGATEDNGDVYGFSLVYSGNFRLSADVGQFGTTRVNLGINPFGFEWVLEKDETFITPEALLVFSARGLTGMSHIFHRTCRRYLGKSKYRNQLRPIILNSWEAVYFNFDEEKIIRMIEATAGLGVDIFVMDDGWFGRRNSDNSSLGDWFVNTEKLPNGLAPITRACRENGMKFGIWIEPEMVSQDSDLYRTHPDWCIHVEGRPHAESRNQLVLDFSRRDVVDYIDASISKLLGENDISYVKWDMNRYLTNNGSALLAPEKQGELSHRYVLGVYDLMERLTTRFPDILFEGCSSGGGRYDFGILYYMPQIWTSDNSDAISRLKIQYGASMAYPTSTMVGHVSVVPNHQTHRVTPLATRADVAMSCNFGYELNPAVFTTQEREEVKRQIARQREIAPLVAFGDFYRLKRPTDNRSCAWELVSPDKKEALVVFVQILTECNMPVAVVKPKGLCPDAVYRIEELDCRVKGDVLMRAGLPLPKCRPDYTSTVFTLKAVE